MDPPLSETRATPTFRMGKESLTLEQTVYGALRDDLVEQRHVDMVLAYYNESAAKVEFTKRYRYS